MAIDWSLKAIEPQIKLKRGVVDLLDLKDKFTPAGTVLEIDAKDRTAGKPSLVNRLKQVVYVGNSAHTKISGDKWGAVLGHDGKPSEIRFGEFHDVEGLLGFLHEAGHLNDRVSGELADKAKEKYKLLKLKDKENALTGVNLLALAEEREAVIKAERYAWAFALRSARSMEHEFGIDILERFGNTEGVINFVNNFLNVYEQRYLDELYDFKIFSIQQLEDILSEPNTANKESK